MNLRRSIVLCEGYDDRAFMAGWLTALGCKDPGEGTPRKPVTDPDRGTPIRGGVHAWTSNGGAFILVVPCYSDDKALEEVRNRLQQRTVERIDRLVVCLDDDGLGVDARRAAVGSRVAAAGGQRESGADGTWTMDTGTVMSVVVWRADDSGAGIPTKQSLERLVCAAICAAHGYRRDAIDVWLRGRPAPAPPACHKAFAWSHMAGWYAENRCDDFYHGVWRDEAIRTELERLLRATGAWEVVQALLS
jgi:hypothetical protein